MIVASRFEGDVDMELAWKQHDVYGKALRIIVSTCNFYARFSTALLADKQHCNWGNVERFDHRTLQMAHDLLAGAWRFENDFQQGTLNLEHEKEESLDPEEAWLQWLDKEVHGWINYPYLVRYVHLILNDQNKAPGYIAESQLCLGIMDRFSWIPWDQSFREACEKDLDKYET